MDTIFLLLFFVSFIALIIGLVKPTAFSRFIKGEIRRKKIERIFGIGKVASFVLFGITTDSSKNNNSEVTTQPVVEETNTPPAPAKTETTFATTQAPTPTPTPAKTVDKPAPTQNISPTPSETISQKNAVKKAKSYLGYSAFSHDGLVAQLEYEQFSHADAVYGADNSGGNWNEQAAKKAKSYMDMSAYSRGSLIAQLKYEKFTQEQAEYGANAVGL